MKCVVVPYSKTAKVAECARASTRWTAGGMGMVWVSRLMLVLVLALAACESPRASGKSSPSDPRPIAVLLGSSVWDPPGALATPRAAVYEDGQVIFTTWEGTGEGFRQEHRTLTLAPTVLEGLRRQVHELAVLKPRRAPYEALDDRHVTDVAYDKIYARDGRREAVVSVYALGWVLREKEHPGRSSFPPPQVRPEERGGPPQPFLSLYHTLDGLARTPGSGSTSKEWTPRQVEVLLRDDFKHKFNRFAPWPTEWPTLDSPRARRTGEHSWVVRLDGTELPRVRRMLTMEAMEQGVSLQGKRWSAFWRPVLPGEAVWGKAMRGR